jgi:polysaccharide export outer membrane protein
MSLRSTTVAPLLMAAMLLGGCATGPGDWLEQLAGNPSTRDTQVAIAQLDEIRPGTSAAVATQASVRMDPADAAVSGNPERQTGYIVEDQSPRQRAYRLDTGDRLRVFVYGQPNLSRLYNVDQSGNISVPLIGNIRARGLTTVGLEGSIRTRLSQGLVRDPQVTVDVQQNRPFFILGEVRNAGQFPYVTGMTVETAVAIAGGFGERANERKARLSRRSGTYNEVIEVTLDTELEPGDTVYIYERFF